MWGKLVYVQDGFARRLAARGHSPIALEPPRQLIRIGERVRGSQEVDLGRDRIFADGHRDLSHMLDAADRIEDLRGYGAHIGCAELLGCPLDGDTAQLIWWN